MKKNTKKTKPAEKSKLEAPSIEVRQQRRSVKMRQYNRRKAAKKAVVKSGTEWLINDLQKQIDEQKLTIRGLKAALKRKKNREI